jgi:cobaltochelatase CobN
MNNADKKIALIYYNYPPGKQDIGASYLNTLKAYSKYSICLKVRATM